MSKLPPPILVAAPASRATLVPLAFAATTRRGPAATVSLPVMDGYQHAYRLDYEAALQGARA